MIGIADTGFLVAFANRTDRYHDWATGLAAQVTAPLLTCEAVLAEAAFHLRNVPLVLAMAREGLVEIAFGGRTTIGGSSRPSPTATTIDIRTSPTCVSSV